MNSTLVGLFNDYKKLSKISTFKCLYGLSLEVEGYTGPLIEIYVSDTASYYDIYHLPNGKLDKQQIISLSGGGNVYVSIIYDQYNFSDAEQSVIANMPKIYDEDDGLIEENGEPIINFDNVNDYMTSTLPYSATDSVVSFVIVVTINTSSEPDFIIAQDLGLKGIQLIHAASNNILLRTYRGVSSVAVSTDTYTAGQTIIIGGVVDRTNIKLYINGVLDSTSTDDNTDFDMASNLAIGSLNAGFGQSNAGIQSLSFMLSDESNNMEALYNELHSRYDSTIPNPRTYFSDKPELLSSGDYANGRLVGDIRYSEHAKIFAWASRPQGGYGAIDIVNIDDQYNNLVTDPFTNFEIFQRINDVSRFMNKTVLDYISSFDEWVIEENGASLKIFATGTKIINIEPYIVTSNTRLRFDFKNTGGEPFYAEVVVDNYPITVPVGWWQLYGSSTSAANQDYNDYTGTDWKSYIIDVGAEALDETVELIAFYNSQDADNSIHFRNVFIYEEGDNIIDYYDKFGTGEIDNTGYIEKGRIRISALSAIEKLNKSINPYIFDSTTYPELENEKPPIAVGYCALVDPRLSKSSTLEYFCDAEVNDVQEVYDQGIAVSYTQTTDGFTKNTNPVGKIRADIVGGDDGTAITYIQDAIPFLLDAINVYNYRQEDLDAIGGIIQLGWYGVEANAKDVIQHLIESMLGYLYTDSSGVYRFGIIEAPSAGETLVEREIHGEPKAFIDKAENLSRYVAGGKNWSPYEQGEIAFAATAADKITYAKDYTITKDTGLINLNAKQVNNPSFKTLLTNATQIQTLADDIASLYSVQRYFYTVSTHRQFKIGEFVNVTYDGKGLELGKDLICIGRDLAINNKIITYSFWG